MYYCSCVLYSIADTVLGEGKNMVGVKVLVMVKMDVFIYYKCVLRATIFSETLSWRIVSARSAPQILL